MSLTGSRAAANPPRRGFQALLGALLLFPALTGAAPLLSVEGASGVVSVTRGEVETVLKEGDALQEGDAVHVGQGARLRVNLSRHGFLDLGSEAELNLERLPASTFADDLHTSLRLDRGFLRLVWQYPGANTAWPLFVYFGNQRASLRAGEYFIEAGAEGALPFCVADGEAAVGLSNSTRPRLLGGPACYSLRTTGERQRRSPDDFVPLREMLSFAGRFEVASDTPPPPPVVAPPAAPAPSRAKSAPVPAAAPAPTPAAVSPPPLVPTGGWLVNAASSADVAVANKEAERLRAAGFNAVVATVSSQGRPWYRVQLAGLPTREAALALMARLKSEFGYGDAWLQKF